MILKIQGHTTRENIYPPLPVTAFLSFFPKMEYSLV